MTWRWTAHRAAEPGPDHESARQRWCRPRHRHGRIHSSPLWELGRRAADATGLATDEGEGYDEDEPYEAEGEDTQQDDRYANEDEAGVVRQTRSPPA